MVYRAALGVARLIKMFAYESRIGEQIGQTREAEIQWMRKKYHLTILSGLYKYVSRRPYCSLICSVLRFMLYRQLDPPAPN